MKRLWVAAAALLPLAASVPAEAVPRYAARYGQRCILCHVDPAGGGQRSLYATQYLIPVELAADSLSAEEIAGIDPVLGRNLSVGLDVRTIYHASDPPRPGIDNFLQMQSAFYLSFQLSERYTAYVNKGQTGTPEVFGIAHVLPFDGYLRAGRFTPAYGWRFADHTMYTRERLGWFAAQRTDVGLEAGVHPGPLSLSGAVTNGNRGASNDGNTRLAYTGQGMWRGRWKELLVGLGGSIWSNRDGAGRRLDRGPYGYLALGPLAWLGEAAWTTLEPPAGGETTGWVVSQELFARLRQGIELRATYDFEDPDIDRRNGSRERLGFGAELLPYPFLAFHPMVRRESYEGVGAVPGAPDLEDATWIELQVHWLY